MTAQNYPEKWDSGFSRTGADVLSDQNADCDDAADQDMQGNSLVNWDSIQVNNWVQAEKYSKTLGTDPLKQHPSLLFFIK